MDDAEVYRPDIVTSVLQVFGDYEIWLAAENGMYLRHMPNEWTPTMDHLNMDWKESVQVEVVTYLKDLPGGICFLCCPNFDLVL